MGNNYIFSKNIPLSKSLINRKLICESYRAPTLFNEQLLGKETPCKDISTLNTSLHDLASGKKSLYVGQGGTVLRFLAFRVSRIPGEYQLHGDPRLFDRPQLEIQSIFDQLGPKIRFGRDRIIIQSTGWRSPRKYLEINMSQSSQFASGVLLNTWKLPFDLTLNLKNSNLSLGYFNLTKETLRSYGHTFTISGESLFIPRQQRLAEDGPSNELDISSAFTIAAFAAFGGKAIISDFPINGHQPDIHFLKIFEKLGIPFEINAKNLTVSKATKLKPIICNLGDSPDLFPVLAVICSMANGTSKLFGAPHLKFKESNRTYKISELLQKMGKKITMLDDGLIIEGTKTIGKTRFSYNPEKDHRLAFAAALAKYIGVPIAIQNPDVTEKSFPNFWDSIPVSP